MRSDIVAELPCPHSGILTYEEDMPGPNLRDATNVDGFDARVMESYSAQLYIRKHLNQLHNMFYRPENGKHKSSNLFAVADLKQTQNSLRFLQVENLDISQPLRLAKTV
jgi:hypothetical protein